MVPDALVPIVIVLAIIAIIRGDASSRDIARIGRSLVIITAIALTILYIPTGLYEALVNRSAPTWLIVATSIPIVLLAVFTPALLPIPTKNRRDS